MRCKKCGAKIDLEDRYCPECGAKLYDAPKRGRVADHVAEDLGGDTTSLGGHVRADDLAGGAGWDAGRAAGGSASGTGNKSALKVILLIFLIVIIFVAVAFFGLAQLREYAISEIVEHFGVSEEDGFGETCERILGELRAEDIIPEDWVFVEDYSSGAWGDPKTIKSFFYIDEDKYEEYEHYWLEGIDASKYYDGMNDDLRENGDWVFHMIEIQLLTYSDEVEYNDILLESDTPYYLVSIYDKASYFCKVKEMSNGFSISPVADYDEESLTKKMICTEGAGSGEEGAADILVMWEVSPEDEEE